LIRQSPASVTLAGGACFICAPAARLSIAAAASPTRSIEDVIFIGTESK
jgi:hypothetical protein